MASSVLWERVFLVFRVCVWLSLAGERFVVFLLLDSAVNIWLYPVQAPYA